MSWRGVGLPSGEELSAFLAGPVAERLDDAPGLEDLRIHLRGLALTGMGHQSLAAVLAAAVPEEREWAAGEALAEAYLMECHAVVFPWNMERDKRNPFGSLPGADLVGFVPADGSFRLALGEVKCSREAVCPPQVMSGRSGHMGHQIDQLAHDLSAVFQLLRWLHPRVKGSEHETAFNGACAAYFNSGNRDAALFGVLVRDTVPDVRDLSGRGAALRALLVRPTTCALIALYLPWPLDQLTAQIRRGGRS